MLCKQHSRTYDYTLNVIQPRTRSSFILLILSFFQKKTIRCGVWTKGKWKRPTVKRLLDISSSGKTVQIMGDGLSNIRHEWECYAITKFLREHEYKTTWHLLNWGHQVHEKHKEKLPHYILKNRDDIFAF
jgi:hypothetical protein